MSFMICLITTNVIKISMYSKLPILTTPFLLRVLTAFKVALALLNGTCVPNQPCLYYYYTTFKEDCQTFFQCFF